MVKAGTRKNKKQAAEAAATAAAYRAAVESSMASSLGDDSHLIHKPTKHGLGVSELTGAMSVADAMQIPSVNGASPSVVSTWTVAHVLSKFRCNASLSPSVLLIMDGLCSGSCQLPY